MLNLWENESRLGSAFDFRNEWLWILLIARWLHTFDALLWNWHWMCFQKKTFFVFLDESLVYAKCPGGCQAFCTWDRRVQLACTNFSLGLPWVSQICHSVRFGYKKTPKFHFLEFCAITKRNNNLNNNFTHTWVCGKVKCICDESI